MTPKPNTLIYKGKRLWMLALFTLLSIAVGIIFILFYQYNTLPGKRYFSISDSGNTSELIALDKPNVESKSLMRWAALAATAVYTTDFVHFDERLKTLRQEYFTRSGYDNLLQAMEEIGFFKDIAEKKLYVTAVPLEVPVILETGTAQGRESWLIGVKLLVNYQTSSESKPQTKKIKMLVTRVPTTEASKGIGIVQFNVSDVQFG